MKKRKNIKAASPASSKIMISPDLRNPFKRDYLNFFINLAAILLGALFFAAIFPNVLIENGLPFLAWIVYVPIFWVIRRSSFKACFFWGAIYGYSAYGLFNYWLTVFHPLAGIIVGSIYLVYLAFLFPLLKLAVVLFPRRFYLFQFLIWMSFEYLRTLGFLGYSYGISGYSQWTQLPLIQIASITGVWGISALVVFPSAALAAALPVLKTIEIREIFDPLLWKRTFITFVLRERIAIAFWALALISSLVYGYTNMVDYKDAPTSKIALIQHNTDPWRGGIEQYRINYQILRRLSDEAIMEHPDLDLVVWSETAFVPRIHWHLTIRDDHLSWILVRDLLDYLASQDLPFIIGNDDARSDPVINPDPRENHRIDYNAAILFVRGEWAEQYRKLHLVPFTEHFPYGRQFPWIYNALRNADTHFWEKGNEATVFQIGDLKFSTPICFEDTFGYLSRNFVRNGAELIVNLSNDAWSASLAAQNQHLSMAVFRSVENRRSMVRSTSSGQTCGIDPNGKILAMAPPFTEAWLVAEVPIVTVSAFYTRHGDWLPPIFISLSAILLIFGIVSVIIKKDFNPHLNKKSSL